MCLWPPVLPPSFTYKVWQSPAAPSGGLRLNVVGKPVTTSHSTATCHGIRPWLQNRLAVRRHNTVGCCWQLSKEMCRHAGLMLWTSQLAPVVTTQA
jgi:hypothetical protein